jgi:hypothetical protein
MIPRTPPLLLQHTCKALNIAGPVLPVFRLRPAHKDCIWCVRKKDFSGMRNHFAGMKNDLSGMQNHFAGMKNDFSGMQNRFSGIKICGAAFETVYLSVSYHSPYRFRPAFSFLIIFYHLKNMVYDTKSSHWIFTP